INHHETVIAAHPRRPTLLACSMLGDTRDRAVNTVAYRSNDGGATWALASIADEHFADDPSCAYGPDGTAYFVTKTNTGVGMVRGASSDTDSLHIRRSRDGGTTWDPVLHSIHANDRPWIAIDTTRGARRGTLYVTFDDHVHGENGRHGNDDFRHLLVLAASRDQGRTFPVAAARALLDQRGDTGSASLAAGVVVLSNGTTVVLQHHLLLGANNTGTGKLRELGGWLQVFVSPDGGHSLQQAAKIADVSSGYNLAASRGVTGTIAADPGSARFRDRLYVAWTDFSSGRGIIRFTSSQDEGRTWSAPTALGEDRTASEPNGSPDNYMPTLAVNRDGVVGISWHDRRARPGNAAYDVRFAASMDGGETWLASVAVSTAPNDEQQQRKGASTGRPSPDVPGWRPAEGTFLASGGDTAGLAADAEGRFHALWIDNRTGVQQVWTAPITIR
ncbi:MAG: sialidase family protein, partial [Gemmatimonadaceae bacterium]